LSYIGDLDNAKLAHHPRRPNGWRNRRSTPLDLQSWCIMVITAKDFKLHWPASAKSCLFSWPVFSSLSRQNPFQRKP